MSTLSPYASPLELDRAQHLAGVLIHALRPSCERIEAAGAIRRRSPTVNDIELIAIPRVERDVLARGEGELFASLRDIDHLELMVGTLKRAGILAAHPVKPAEGDRYKRLWMPKQAIQVDLFIVRPPAQHGALLALRTGPARFSQMLVTKLRMEQRRLDEGRVIDFHGNAIDCKDERDFFRLCGVPYIAPEQRGDE